MTTGAPGARQELTRATALIVALLVYNFKLPGKYDRLALIPLAAAAVCAIGLPPRYLRSTSQARSTLQKKIIRSAGKDIEDRGLFLNFLIESRELGEGIAAVDESAVREALADLSALEARAPARAIASAATHRRNVYLISQESFWDPARALPKESRDGKHFLSPRFESLWKDSGGRYVVSPSFGGGTANYEFEVLCGLPAHLVSNGMLFSELTARAPECLPRLLSEEESPNATVWALGTDVPGEVIWHAFALAGAPPPAKGVFLSEENRYTARAWRRARMGAVTLIPLAAAMLLRAAVVPRSSWLHTPWPYAILLAVCALPAAVDAQRSAKFERERWSASDYAGDGM